MKPILLVVAGPNGSGKTTVTVRLREERWSEGVEYLNPDEIARDRFGDWNAPAAVLSAAQWAAARREELLDANAGIAFETVLSTQRRSPSWSEPSGKVYGPLPEWVADAVIGLARHEQFADARVQA